MSSSVGIIIPNIWKVIKAMFQTTDQKNWIHQPSHYISIKCHGSLGNLGNFGAHLPARHSQTVTKWRRIPVQIAKANPTPWGFDRVNHRLSYGPMDLYPGCGEKKGWVTGFHGDNGFIIMSWTCLTVFWAKSAQKSVVWNTPGMEPTGATDMRIIFRPFGGSMFVEANFQVIQNLKWPILDTPKTSEAF